MSRRTLRFLALGDSLTEGYYNYGGDFHPYTIQLQHRFDTMNPAVVLQYFGMDSDTDVKFKVFNSGVSGETTEDMLPRLEYLLRSDQGPNILDYICILGGTNDLAYSNSPDAIYSSIQELYNVAIRHCHHLVCVTIPESGVQEARYIQVRGAVNDRIRSFVRDFNLNPSNSICKKATLCDLELAISYWDESEDGRKPTENWDDNLHMTPRGYDRFGDLIFDEIFKDSTT